MVEQSLKPSTIERITEILREECSLQTTPISEDSNLLDLGLDELDTVCIVIRIEEVYRISIEDIVFDKWVTVSDIVKDVDYLISKKTKTS